MASRDSLEVKSLLARGVVRRVAQDEAIGLRLRYIGTGTVTTVAVTQGTSVVLTTSDGLIDTYDFDTATNATLGGLCDNINADGIFEAIVVDALRSEDPDDFFVTNGTVTVGMDETGNSVYDLLVDANVALTMAACFSPLKPSFDLPSGHRVHLQQIDYKINNTAAAATLKIYKRKGAVETLIYSATNTDNSAASLSWASGEGKITGGVDEDIVVFFDGTLVDATGGNIQLLGIYE